MRPIRPHVVAKAEQFKAAATAFDEPVKPVGYGLGRLLQKAKRPPSARTLKAYEDMDAVMLPSYPSFAEILKGPNYTRS